MKKTGIASVLAIIVLLQLSGCMSLGPLPNKARAGETVALSLGSPDNMALSNIDTVELKYIGVPTPVDLKPYVRSVFNIYADKASKVYESGFPPAGLSTNQIVNTAGHEPWSTIMVIDLPDIITEPALLPGEGHVKIRTLPGTVTYPTTGSHINDLQANGLRVSLEILPGAGEPNPFLYEFGTGSSRPLAGQDDLPNLEPQPRIVVRPPFVPSGGSPYRTDLGATEIKVDLSSCNNKGSALTDADLRLVNEDMTVHTLSQRSVSSSVDSSDILDIIFISTVGKLHYFEPRVTILLKDGLAPGCNPWFYTNSGTEAGIEHFDIDGVAILDNSVPFPAVNPLSPDTTTEYYIEVR